jgi:glucose-6-phosphate isomerase
MELTFSKKAQDYLSRLVVPEQLKTYIVDILPGALKDFSYQSPESALALPFDGVYQEKVKTILKEKVAVVPQYIFFLGMGGSSLGARALYEHWTVDWFSQSLANGPQIIFFDNLDQNKLSSFDGWLDAKVTKPEEVLLLVSTKSGTTSETLAMGNILFGALTRRFGVAEAANRTVVITEEGSPLWQEAVNKKITSLSVPHAVSGRFSVFSPSNMTPFIAADWGVVHEEMSRAKNISESFLSTDVEKNSALAHALVVHQALLDGNVRYEHFFCHTSFLYTGKWCMQLVAESLGKKKEGVPYPSVFINSTDMHSLLQENIEGPQNFYTLFTASRGKVPLTIGETLVSGTLSQKSPVDLLETSARAAQEVYESLDRPFATLTLNALDGLGGFMQWKMAETMFLGVLLGVNAFNQPGVELYKKRLHSLS